MGKSLFQDILNRVGTKAIVGLTGMYFLFQMAMADKISPEWATGGIVSIVLSFFVIKHIAKEHNGKDTGTNPPSS